MSDTLLILFARSPEIGKAKTRIAKDSSDEYAYQVYQYLLGNILSIIKDSKFDKQLCYCGDKLILQRFLDQKKIDIPLVVQQGNDIGEKMFNAISEGLESYKKVILFGSDIPSLSFNKLSTLDSKLDFNDIVIIPACDGGYVCIGCKVIFKELFDIDWSKEVLPQTINSINLQNKSYFLMSSLTDVDTIEDLKKINYPKS